MDFNTNVIEGKWNEIKGELQKTWGKLTQDELEQTKGDMKAIKGLLQQKYGQTREDFNSELERIYQRFEEKKDSTVESVKSSLRQ